MHVAYEINYAMDGVKDCNPARNARHFLAATRCRAYFMYVFSQSIDICCQLRAVPDAPITPKPWPLAGKT